MGIMCIEDVKRLAKKLKRILQDDLGEETRLGQCQAAIAEGFDFANYQEMLWTLPAPADWHPEWCVNALFDEGHVRLERNAAEAVAMLEGKLGFLIDGR